LLPPSLRDWLPEEHLAFFLSDTIDALDLKAFEARYGDAGPGNQAFDPRMMLKVLVYAYATGTFSSRKIAAKLHEDVAYRVLGSDNFPAHHEERFHQGIGGQLIRPASVDDNALTGEASHYVGSEIKC